MVVNKKENAHLYHALAFLGQLARAEKVKEVGNRPWADVIHFEQGRESLEHIFGVVTDGHRMHVIPFIRSAMPEELLGDYTVKGKAGQIELVKTDIKCSYPSWREVLAEKSALASGVNGVENTEYMRLHRHNGYYINGADLTDLAFVLGKCNIKIAHKYLEETFNGVLQGDWFIYQRDLTLFHDPKEKDWEKTDRQERHDRIMREINNAFSGALLFKFVNFPVMFGDYAVSPSALIMPRLTNETLTHPLCGLSGYQLLVRRYTCDEARWDRKAVKKALTDRYLF